MTNDIDEYDDFREANLLLSTTLKQLDDALTKGVPGSLYRLYSNSVTSVNHQSTMNGNEYERRSVTPQQTHHSQQSNGSAGKISSNSLNGNNKKDVNQNGSVITPEQHQQQPQPEPDFNGKGVNEAQAINDTLDAAAAAVKISSTYENSASTVSNLTNVKPMPLAWNASITNWINQTTKISPESSGSCTPDSSKGEESPLSDLVHSSSANGLDDPLPTTQISSPPSPVGKLLQAIEENRLNVPIDAESKLKIIQWLNKIQEHSSREFQDPFIVYTQIL
jgi:hypothetical protein